MAGHGSPSPPDRGDHPNRRVDRPAVSHEVYKAYRIKGYNEGQSLAWAKQGAGAHAEVLRSTGLDYAIPHNSPKPEPRTRPISTYFTPHETEEYKR